MAVLPCRSMQHCLLFGQPVLLTAMKGHGGEGHILTSSFLFVGSFVPGTIPCAQSSTSCHTIG